MSVLKLAQPKNELTCGDSKLCSASKQGSSITELGINFREPVVSLRNILPELSANDNLPVCLSTMTVTPFALISIFEARTGHHKSGEMVTGEVNTSSGKVGSPGFWKEFNPHRIV